jgi:hypothetical protein
VNTRKVEPAPSYNRAPCMIDAKKCLDFTVYNHQKSQQRTNCSGMCTATLEGEQLKIFTDRSLKDERVGNAIVTPETTSKNRMRSQTTIFSAEQEAIFKAI